MKFFKNVIKKMNGQNGIGLVEVIAAFSISIVVITALVSLALYTLRSSLHSKLLLEGTKIATREIERVRALRDTLTTWDQFKDDIDSGDGDGADCTCQSTPCAKKCVINIGPPISVSTGQGTETIDNQVLTYYFYAVPDASDPSNIVRIFVGTSWTIGGQNKGTNIYTDLTNWRPE